MHHRKLIAKDFKVEVYTFYYAERNFLSPITSDARHKFRFNFSRCEKEGKLFLR